MRWSDRSGIAIECRTPQAGVQVRGPRTALNRVVPVNIRVHRESVTRFRLQPVPLDRPKVAPSGRRAALSSSPQGAVRLLMIPKLPLADEPATA